MEFLRGKFHQDISAEFEGNGDINIEGYTFSRESILEEMEPTGYEEAFNEWLERHQEEMLRKADQLLDLHDNRLRFNKLKEAYKNGALIPFVGAGMSKSSGYPGWTSFLWQLRNETRVTQEELKVLLDAGKYEEAVQRMADDMPAGSFDETLENTFGHDLDLDGPIQLFPFLFEPCVITTNFDDVLKRCYENADKPFRDVLLGVDSPDLPRYLGRKEKVLVKLHGKANSGRGRILTLKEYQTHYGVDASLTSRIEEVCESTLLFIGCSLSIDRTLMAMRELVATKGHESAVRHYAFLPLKIGEDRLARRDQLAQANIFPIWYPDEEDHDECIEALLHKLADGVVDIYDH